MTPSQPAAGISGMSLYLPRLRVPLEQWCDWTGNSWDKINAVVGRSFRCAAPHENVYTMAATAVLRLIKAYDIDPRSVGFLGFGTESSTDNSAGAVIVRGMLDRELDRLGLPRLSRSCEVPEFKHACLGGVYALKGALRYVAADGAGRQAIVVCGDLATYERGSSGEPTQGAGAVAMLVEQRPALLEIDITAATSASDYRGPDFRKPRVALRDYPEFSGKYSTYAYLDQTAHAVEAMLARESTDALSYYKQLGAVFLHRPYRLMPLQALAFLYLRALLHAAGPELDDLCVSAQVDVAALRAEALAEPDLFATVLDSGDTPNPFPLLSVAASHLRKTASFQQFIADKASLGSAAAMEFGNLYTASLPGWLAAGLAEAADQDGDLAGASVLALGYGSGDAAEAIPMRVAPGWRRAAARIDVRGALADVCDLDRAQYEELHDGVALQQLAVQAHGQFRITHTGSRHEPSFQDRGVEYYDYAH